MNAWADHPPIFMANPIQRNKIEGQGALTRAIPATMKKE
jgi:hypothetical protein